MSRSLLQSISAQVWGLKKAARAGTRICTQSGSWCSRYEPQERYSICSCFSLSFTSSFCIPKANNPNSQEKVDCGFTYIWRLQLMQNTGSSSKVPSWVCPEVSQIFLNPDGEQQVNKSWGNNKSSFIAKGWDYHKEFIPRAQRPLTIHFHPRKTTIN